MGTRLGRFRVTRLIGTGGMGEVYAAVDEDLDREVALKVLGAALDVEPHRRRFLREARLAARLNHPNIASIHEVGDSDGRRYIVMELLEGKTLRAQMAERPLTVEQTLSIARDVARALARAHAGDVVHRDIKPENIFVTTPAPGMFFTKVLDFGLARDEMLLRRSDDEETATDITGPGEACGTAGYIAPEQAQGSGVDARADVFAFGAVFYEMLTGKRAFDGRNPLTRMLAVMKPHPPLRSRLPDVSTEVEGIVERCLAKERDARYPDGSALLAAIEEVVGGPSASSPELAVASASYPMLPTGKKVSTETPPPSTRSAPRLPLEAEGRKRWPFVVAVGAGAALAALVMLFGLPKARPAAAHVFEVSGAKAGGEPTEAPVEKASGARNAVAASSSEESVPPAPVEPAKAGTVRFQSINVMTVIVDGEHHRVRGGSMTLSCGRHRIRVGLNGERVVDVPCGGSVLF
ncbi:MAG: serine/threonine protein kinase [Labilithrix sp.]|nr:serine/threonine protein kinase [Labilithrix sp.]